MFYEIYELFFNFEYNLKEDTIMSMFCYQCQETAKGTGCTIAGVCGKKEDVAAAQDLLIWTSKGVSILNRILAENQMRDSESDRFIIEALFTTITNANFDRKKILEKVKEAFRLREELIRKIREAGLVLPDTLHSSVVWKSEEEDALMEKAHKVGVLTTGNEDERSLKELLVYGIKGIAAYAEHAWNLGYKKDEISDFIQKGLSATTRDDLSTDELFNLVMECGKYGVEAMALLDQANTESYGNPEITEVQLGVRKNPGILISGHDLKDMEELLKQSEGSGVDIYTHSEMLPANYYPAFKKYDHFVGNYGNSWWKQKEEFESFNGPVLLTTNCLVPPKASYKERIYTTGVAGFDGCYHIPDANGKPKDFSIIIEHAKKCASPEAIESGTLIGGFAHHQVMQLSDSIVEAVKKGKIKKFVVMAGCDGRMPSRNYYSDFAAALPEDHVILTAGCAKYRYNKLQLGDIDGIPRVLDAGQCNDSYSLAIIAMKLKEVFGLDDINKLPIFYNIAWYEQKAVIVLLALLYLGVKNIHLGPSLPAFLSANVASVLIEKFGISGISSVEEDIKIMTSA
jgi:hydroxylamine reductase